MTMIFPSARLLSADGAPSGIAEERSIRNEIQTICGQDLLEGDYFFSAAGTDGNVIYQKAHRFGTEPISTQLIAQEVKKDICTIRKAAAAHSPP
jgi:hypothetical protein